MREAMSASEPLSGARVTPLTSHSDDRGCLTELLRNSWQDTPAPIQWNTVTSEANVLRGVHVHRVHWDYFFLLSGEMLFGMHDMRPASPTYRRSVLLPLTGDKLTCVTVPPGVAHGFYYVTPSLHVYAVTHYHDHADEMGCRWDSPELGLKWTNPRPKLSKRDENAMSYAELAALLARGHS